MPFAPSSPVTGAAITGLTLPTYTLTADTPPNANSKQFAVTALGGTQTSVDTNMVSKPFTMTFFRPPVLRPLPQARVDTGIISNIPVNRYTFLLRKGGVPAANQVPQLIKLSFVAEIPAGVDAFEPEEIRAAMSCFVGTLSANADGICSILLTGVL